MALMSKKVSSDTIGYKSMPSHESMNKWVRRKRLFLLPSKNTTLTSEYTIFLATKNPAKTPKNIATNRYSSGRLNEVATYSLV